MQHVVPHVGNVQNRLAVARGWEGLLAGTGLLWGMETPRTREVIRAVP